MNSEVINTGDVYTSKVTSQRINISNEEEDANITLVTGNSQTGDVIGIKSNDDETYLSVDSGGNTFISSVNIGKFEGSDSIDANNKPMNNVNIQSGKIDSVEIGNVDISRLIGGNILDANAKPMTNMNILSGSIKNLSLIHI